MRAVAWGDAARGAKGVQIAEGADIAPAGSLTPVVVGLAAGARLHQHDLGRQGHGRLPGQCNTGRGKPQRQSQFPTVLMKSASSARLMCRTVPYPVGN
jgi:hypothetical protein